MLHSMPLYSTLVTLAQRWMDPGDHKGGAIIHNFYSCCGGGEKSLGCCARKHMTFDEG